MSTQYATFGSDVKLGLIPMIGLCPSVKRTVTIKREFRTAPLGLNTLTKLHYVVLLYEWM